VSASTDPTGRLFVYGTLVEAAERVRLLGRDSGAVPAILDGYERGCLKHFFVRPRAGTATSGAVLDGLIARDFEILDAYEDIPTLYTRDVVSVTIAGGAIIAAWIYLPTAWAQE
jgi:gamma-glutamylcyclotransferase (GGCT)/AIG2-like uncharacterized protein YtfP